MTYFGMLLAVQGSCWMFIKYMKPQRYLLYIGLNELPSKAE